MRGRLAVILTCALSVAGIAQTRSKFFQTSDDIKIHYLEAGSGRPIVFIPGWTMPAWIWQEQIDKFSKKYRVIAVDPRSQGESDKPTFGHLPETRARDYKELVDHLALKQPVLVGWSMGCDELLEYIEEFGDEDISGLVLVDELISEKPSPEVLLAISEEMNQLQQYRQRETDRFVRSMFRKPHGEDYLKRVIQASIQVPVDTAVVLIYNVAVVKNFASGFAKINRPVLFVYEPDTQQSADFLKSKLGDDIRLERFDGDGHALFVDEPERFDQVLEEFLQSLPK